jgi:hypothetical protein
VTLVTDRIAAAVYYVGHRETRRRRAEGFPSDRKTKVRDGETQMTAKQMNHPQDFGMDCRPTSTRWSDIARG